MSKNVHEHVPDMRDVDVFILAGGEGTRLGPLTEDAPKPYVSIGGKFRVIDFALSNAVNSGARRILLATMYGHRWLQRHTAALHLEGAHVELLPPSHYKNPDGSTRDRYLGTADAVYQNIRELEESRATYVLILAGDHVYTMDYTDLLRQALRSDASFTIVTMGVSPRDAKRFGVLSVDADNRVTGFAEKPANPMPGPNGTCCASLGIYLVKKSLLLSELRKDAALAGSSRDFGKDIIPRLIADGKQRIESYDFESYVVPNQPGPYWRDVGVAAELFAVNEELHRPDPPINVYNVAWPIETARDRRPPMKMLKMGEDDRYPRPAWWTGDDLGFTAAGGVTIDPHQCFHAATLGRGVHVARFCQIDNSIIDDDARVEYGVRMRRTYVKAGLTVPAGAVVGYSKTVDEANGHTVTPDGYTIVTDKSHWKAAG